MLTEEQRRRLFEGEPCAVSVNSTPAGPWFVHPAMPWEDVRDYFRADYADKMIAVNERPPGLGDDYTPEREVYWRKQLLARWTDETLRRRCAELAAMNQHLQKMLSEVQ